MLLPEFTKAARREGTRRAVDEEQAAVDVSGNHNV